MPSAQLAPGYILQSFPTPLGRRGTVAVTVIGLHLLFASALILGLAARDYLPPRDEPLVGTILPPPERTSPPRSTPALDPKASFIPAQPEPFYTPIPRFDGPSAPTQPVSNGVTESVGVAPEALTPPRVLKQLDPLYPAADRRAEHEGTVVVRVLIGEDGRAQQVEVAGSSGYPGLDAAAVASVKRWTFAPARNGGGPVAGWASVKVRFQIDRS